MSLFHSRISSQWKERTNAPLCIFTWHQMKRLNGGYIPFFTYNILFLTPQTWKTS